MDATDLEKLLKQIRSGDPNFMTIVRMLQYTSTFPGRLKAQTLSLDPDAAYLITGGFGGPKKVLVTWLVEKEARALLMLSPLNSKDSDDEDVIAEVESCGCTVLKATGEVQYVEDVKKAIALTDRPVKGVVHLVESVKVWARILNLYLHAQCCSEYSIP